MVTDLLNSEEVRNVRSDRELFNYFYHETSEEMKDTWTVHYDEPTRKIKTK